MLRQLNRLSRKHTVEASPPSREKKVYNIRARHKNKTLSVLLFKPCVFQRIKYRCFVSSFSISFRHRRYTHQALNLLQHKLSLAGQEGLQQPKRSVCLLGKLQVTLPCISADTRHQRMQWYQADQSQLLWSVLVQYAVTFLGRCMSGYSTEHASMQRLHHRYSMDSTQKNESSLTLVFVRCVKQNINSSVLNLRKSAKLNHILKRLPSRKAWTVTQLQVCETQERACLLQWKRGCYCFTFSHLICNIQYRGMLVNHTF